MSKIILTIGTSSSGKTSWANAYAKEHSDVVVTSRDDFLYDEEGNSRWSPDVNPLFQRHYINKAITKTVHKALEAGQTVVIADANIHHMSRDHWQRIALEHKAQLEFVIFQSKNEELIRNLTEDPWLAFDLPKHVHEQSKKLTAFIQEEQIPSVNYQFI